ncbi:MULTISPECIES: hypothetical protein [unclassified Synechococcus]|uniref:hypothetical protein n=1 Tax=unclassified Synechococcus TaxID=2626047 RepID=UPI0039B12612
MDRMRSQRRKRLPLSFNLNNPADVDLHRQAVEMAALVGVTPTELAKVALELLVTHPHDLAPILRRHLESTN